MLAQNFMRPEALSISRKLHDALIKLLGMLERGEIAPANFDMRRWKSDCGTAFCLGGWAEQIAGVKEGTFKIGMFDTCTNGGWGEGPQKLFAPDGWTEMKATPAQAAIALRNYLTTGEPRWAEALSA